MTQNRSSAVMQQRAEEWRAVEGWPGYEVSDLGRVRSWRQRSPGRTWLVRHDLSPRILAADIRNRYPSVLLCVKGLGRKWFCVHRLVLSAFVGPRGSEWHGAHNNGDSLDNRLENLRWATAAENNADKRRHGTRQNGERVGTAKLTQVDVDKIRAARGTGASTADLAREFGVHRNTIWHVVSGRNWRVEAEA